MNTDLSIIDVNKWKITMKFDVETTDFNIFKAMRHPTNVSPFYQVDVIDTIT